MNYVGYSVVNMTPNEIAEHLTDALRRDAADAEDLMGFAIAFANGTLGQYEVEAGWLESYR